jgi:hypothetical protein
LTGSPLDAETVVNAHDAVALFSFKRSITHPGSGEFSIRWMPLISTIEKPKTFACDCFQIFGPGKSI